MTSDLSGAELRRWYWTRAELATFARSVGASAGGGKDDLTQRLADLLDGHEPREPPRTALPTGHLQEPLTGATVIPRGQRCSQPVREWFRREIGGHFRFDQAMRDFFATNDGTATLHDAVQHWHRTRSRTPNPIGSQFELNRFARRWHAEHPGTDRQQLLAAWREYRALPVDLRGRA